MEAPVINQIKQLTERSIGVMKVHRPSGTICWISGYPATAAQSRYENASCYDSTVVKEGYRP